MQALEYIVCRLWEYTQKWIDFRKILMEQIESYKQCYVYNGSHIDVCFEIEKVQMNVKHNTKHAARKTQIVRLV